MRLKDLPTNDEVLARVLQDPAFRTAWEKNALARGVAIGLVRYRADHDLTQTELGELLDFKQEQIARWESGTVTPSWENICRISAGLDIEFTIDITPAGREPQHVTAKGRKSAVGEVDTDGARVLVAMS